MDDFPLPLSQSEWPGENYFVSLGSQPPNAVLECIETDLKKDFCVINDVKNIGKLLSIIANDTLKKETKDKLMYLLYNGCLEAKKVVSDFSEKAKNGFDDGVRHRVLLIRNAIKMFVFLTSRFVQLEEKQSQQSKKGHTEKSVASNKSSKASRAASHSYGLKSWASEEDKEAILCALIEILKLDLSVLWDCYVDHNFINLYIQLVFCLLSNPDNCKNLSVRSCCVQLIGLLIGKYKRLTECLSHIMHHLRSHQSLVAVIVESLRSLKEYPSGAVDFFDGILSGMLISSQELNVNSELSKTFSSLLEQMSEQIPEAMISSTQSLIEFLDCESHLIRNAVVRVFEKLVVYVSSLESSDAPSGEYVTLREELFQVLVERFLDVSSYTRAQVVQSWSFLCSERLIDDYERYNMVARHTVARLRDKAALVRKFAMRLFCDLLTYNPYHKNLCLSFWEKVEASLDQEVDQADEDALIELQNFLEKSKQTMEFAGFVREAIARATQLLGSRIQSDVIEAIRFLSRASFFCGSDTADGIKVVLTLVCSNEVAIKEAAKEAYISMFFSPEDTKVPIETYIAKNLIALTQHATLGQMISLEELLKQLYKTHDKNLDNLSQKLRDIFTLGVKSELTYGSIIVLSMMASIHPVLVVSWLPSILQHGLGREAVKDPQLAKWSCVAIQKLALYLDKHPASALPMPLDGVFFKFFTDLLELRGSCRPDQEQTMPIEGRAWYPAAEQAIAAIYALSKKPEAIMERVLGVYALNSLGSRYFKKSALGRFGTEGAFLEVDDSSGLSRLSRLSKLERLVFLVGQVATRQVAFIERVAWNKRVRRAEEQLERKDIEDKAGCRDSCGDTVESLVYEQQMIEDLDRIKMNDEVDMKNEQEDHERAALERNIVQPSNLIGALYPVIKALCQSEEVQNSLPFLHGMAIDAFSRFTLSCSEQCAANIGLLGECLSNRKAKVETRRNIVVAFCDLATRFPNEFETQASVLFDCLSEDEDSLVKRNALLVLSHLIFTLRIKPRGRLGDLAMCLVAKDPYVSNLSQLFFCQLAKNKKEEYIKCLPEMLTSLLFEKRVPIQVLENVAPFLFSFIETQAESVFMVEKLCSHFQTNMIDQNQVLKSLAYLITCLSHSEATILRLIQLFKYYKHAVYEDQVKGYFLSVCAKARRLHACPLANQLEEMVSTGEAMEVDLGSTRQRSTLLRKVKKRPVR